MTSIEKSSLKIMATVSLIYISLIVTLSIISVFRIAPETRIERIELLPWEVEISTPWEFEEGTGLTEIKEAEVPEWYRGHGEITPAEAKALEEYKSEYPDQELGANPIPCTINGVKGIVYKNEEGHIYINYGPIHQKKIG